MLQQGLQLLGFKISSLGERTSHQLKEFSGGFDLYEATHEEIDIAVQLAADASLRCRNLNGAQKIRFFLSIIQGIEEQRKQLIITAKTETNLSEARLDAEITRTLNQIRMFAKLLDDGSWVRAIIDPSDQPGKPDVRQVWRSVGPVVVFGAGNFPFAFSVAGSDTISAIAAGCPVIYKSHPGHPATSSLVGNIIIQAAQNTQMPEGIFSLLHCASHLTTEHLVQHAEVAAIAFTGSYRGGKALQEYIAKRKRPIPLYAEMGSINPVFLLRKILREKSSEIAKSLAASNNLGVGQFCTKPGVIIFPEDDSAEFLQVYAECINTAADAAMLNNATLAHYQQALDFLISTGRNIRSTGAIDSDPGMAKACMFQVKANEFMRNESLQQEIFGPASIHVGAKNNEEMYAVAEQLQGQLTISIWGNAEDLSDNKELIEMLESKAGRLLINSVPTGVEVTRAMMHGGPFPASFDSKYSSVGSESIYRFARPVCFQNFPDETLPDSLKNGNPLNIIRCVDNVFTRDIIYANR